jgi:hypothetical protein
VSLHTRQLLTSAQVTATPDLALNTVSHFLDRFVYKNPKKPKSRGASAMQPAAWMGGASGAVRMIRGGISGLEDNVNAESFWTKPVEDVPVDQVRVVRVSSAIWFLRLKCCLSFIAVLPQVLCEQTWTPEREEQEGGKATERR